MHKKIVCKIGLVILAFSMITACSREQTYRGVPDPTWQQLTPEQKQLIVDQAYQEDLEQPSTKTKKSS